MGNCQNLSVGNDPIKAEKIKKNNSNNLTIKTYTWSRDSHGLFDYESKGIIKNQLKIPEPGIIVRDKEEIKILTQQNYKGDQPDIKKLACVEIRNNHYVVDSEFITNTETDYKVKKSSQDEGIGDLCVWAVVKSLKTSKGQKGYELQVGDYLKLGRVRFRIKELQGLDTEKKQNKYFMFGSNLNILNMDEMSQEEEAPKQEDDAASNGPNTCRICLGDNDEPDNPFITPCKCDGTMKCIHIKCLQQWLKSRLHPKQTPYSISFVWKTFDCELCKHQFPNMVKVKGNVYDTVEIPRPAPPYVTMEILSKDKNICKGIHVITLSQKNQIRLGRGHDSDIRISDISVSRCHAILSYDSGIFTIEDNNSKFGTLALIKEPIQLNNQNNNIAIQVGRTVLSFILKKNWKIYQVAIPPQSMANKQNAQNKSESSPEKVEKKGPKIKTIEAPGQKDEENVMVINQKYEEDENHNQIQQGNHHPPRFMSQQAEGSNPINQIKNNLQLANHYSGSDNEQGGNHQQSNQANNNFQLPEFKDPAEELEAFQRQQEKEKEIEILQQQLTLIKQHKNINQQNLLNLQNNSNEEQKNDHEKEKTKISNTIEQYNTRIKDIEQQIKVLQQSHKNELKENNNQSNNLISERSENVSYRKNGYQESMFADNNTNLNGQKIQKSNLNNTEYNPNGDSQQQTERNLRQN